MGGAWLASSVTGSACGKKKLRVQAGLVLVGFILFR